MHFRNVLVSLILTLLLGEQCANAVPDQKRAPQVESQRQSAVPPEGAMQYRAESSVVALYVRVSDLIFDGKDAEAKPLMKQYVELLEYKTAHHQASKEVLKSTYLSYGRLLSRLHEDAQAKQVFDKATAVH